MDRVKQKKHMETVRPRKSKQGNTTNLNSSFSTENGKRVAQVGFEPMTQEELLRWDSNP